MPARSFEGELTDWSSSEFLKKSLKITCQQPAFILVCKLIQIYDDGFNRGFSVIDWYCSV